MDLSLNSLNLSDNLPDTRRLLPALHPMRYD